MLSYQQRNVQKEKQRYENAEPEFSGLMAENSHAQKTSKAAAYESSQKQSCFGDPQKVLFCKLLVCTHKEKTCRID